MKHFFITLITLLGISALNAQPQATVRVFQDNGLKIVCTSTQPTHTNQEIDMFLTRKKNTTAAIFNGFAQACSNLVNIIMCDSPKAKQQAILSVIGTVCNVTAELTDKNSNNQAQRDIQAKTVAHSFAELTTTLLKVHEKETSMRRMLPETLALLKNIPEESRASVIELMLSSGKNTYQFLHELFSLALEYLSTCFNSALSTLVEKIDDIDTSNDFPELQTLDLTIPLETHEKK